MFCIKVEYPYCSSTDSESEEEQRKSKGKRKATVTASSERKRKFICESTKKEKACTFVTYATKTSTVQELSNHSATHLEAEFKCTVCGKIRKSQKSFDNHMRFHREGYKTCDPMQKAV